jgi:hypothetical protein
MEVLWRRNALSAGDRYRAALYRKLFCRHLDAGMPVASKYSQMANCPCNSSIGYERP